MTRFDVWAPRARQVTLVVDGADVAMERAQRDGWWTPDGRVPTASEVDYGYRLDGGDTVLPDPRSRRQPGGVHELSRTYE